jgi:hypothetical protein
MRGTDECDIARDVCEAHGQDAWSRWVVRETLSTVASFFGAWTRDQD